MYIIHTIYIYHTGVHVHVHQSPNTLYIVHIFTHLSMFIGFYNVHVHVNTQMIISYRSMYMYILYACQNILKILFLLHLYISIHTYMYMQIVSSILQRYIHVYMHKYIIYMYMYIKQVDKILTYMYMHIWYINIGPGDSGGEEGGGWEGHDRPRLQKKEREINQFILNHNRS